MTALTRKPNERPANNKNNQEEHRMRVLLLSERIKIQPIEMTNEPNKGSVEAKPEEKPPAKPHTEPEKKDEKAEKLGEVACRRAACRAR